MFKIIFLILFVLQGCIISKPKVENLAYMTAGFSHVNFLTTCVACHETKRPAPIAAVAHYGTQDCASCHRPPSWAYSHNPMPATCTTCHEAKRPANANHLDSSGATITTSPHYATQDCVTCHTPVIGIYPAAWNFTHTSKQTSCNSCHEIKRPTTVNGQAHVSTGDCVNCHSTSTWVAFSHSPVPTSCNGCHSAARPANNTGHNTKLSGHYTSVDCKSCHAIPQAPYGNGWSSGASFNCMPCHQSTGQRRHGNSIGNCSQCHSPKARSWGN
jgi:hypothetical protein